MSRAQSVLGRRPAGRRGRVRWLASAVTVPLLLLTAACGSGSSSSSSPGGTGSSGLTHIDVGIIPVGGAAPLKLGIKKGFFKDEGLDVTTHIAKGGAALVPAVISGQYQFSFSNNVSLLAARAKGLPVAILAMADGAGHDPEPADEATIVPKDSPIKSPKDLKGKKIATNTLDNIVQMAVMVMLKKNGVDPFSVNFVEVGFPDMIPALSQGRIDAAAINEPFLTQGKSQGYRVIAKNYRAVSRKFYPSSWFTTDKYISDHKDIARAFQKAIFKSNKYAESHSDEVRAIIPTYTKLSKSAVKNIAIAHWAPEAPPKSMLEQFAKYSVEFKFFKEAPDVSAMLPNLGS